MTIVEVFEGRFCLVKSNFMTHTETYESAMFALKMIRRLARDMKYNGFINNDEYMGIVGAMVSVREFIDQQQSKRDDEEFYTMQDILG